MCGQWDGDRILDHLQGRLPAGESERFVRHAAGCADCRTAIEDLSILAAARPVRPGRAAENAILAAIQREAARRSPARASKPGTRRRLRRVVGAPATAATAAWIAAAAALFAIVLLSALSTSPPAPRAVAVRPIPTPEPAFREERPVVPERPAPPPPQAPDPVPPPKPLQAPVEQPVEPAPARAPAPEPPKSDPKPKPPPTVPDTRPAAAEVAQVVRGAGKTDRGVLAVGDKIVSGESVTCTTGTLLMETVDHSQVAMRAGTTILPEAQGEHLTLKMTEGEVACSVKTRPERKFAVQTPHGNATVKGTVFSVKATSLGTVVAVAKGRVEARTDLGAQDVSAGERSSMSRSTSPGRPEPINAEKHFAWAADAGLAVPGHLWVLATAPAAEYQAPMTRGRMFASGSLSGEPAFAAVDSRTLPGWNGRSLTSNQKDGGAVTFTVDLPEAGAWILWGRFYHPGSGTTLWRQDGETKENDPNSFFASVDGGKEHVFGNLKSDPDTKTSWYRRWHWGGDGKIEVGQPTGLALGVLPKGRHTIRIRNRDAVETSSIHLAPRLDALCLTLDREYRPRDEDVRK